MKKRLFYSIPNIRVGVMCALMGLGALSVTSCGDDYDDTEIKKEIQDVKDRVAKLEEWQKSVNSPDFDNGTPKSRNDE